MHQILYLTLLILYRNQGMLFLFRNLYKTEGLASLWKGIGPTVIGVLPARAIYFASYSEAKNVFRKINGGVESSLVHVFSAITAGLLTTTSTNPIWLVKTRMQLQEKSNLKYKNSLDCLMKIIKQEGVRSLYKGLTASYLGIAESTLQWVLYEHFKSKGEDDSISGLFSS
jgi:solute carrier family 25 protein 33/36